MIGAGSPGIVDSGPFGSRLTPEGRERMFADFALRAPAKRVGVPAEQANAVLFALTSPFPTGSVLPIDGGALLMSPNSREIIHAQTEYRTTSRIPPNRLLSSS